LDPGSSLLLCHPTLGHLELIGMGSTTSCHECKCEDRCQTPTSPTKVRAFSYGESTEEVCDPEGRCKSWAPCAVLVQPVVHPKELPALSQKNAYSDKGRIGIDGECQLRFRLQPGHRFGLELAETTVTQQAGTGKRLASLLVVANVESRSPFSRTADGQLGLVAGDVIVEVDGRRGTAAEVQDMLQQAVPSGTHRDTTLVARRRPSAFDVELLREGPNWEMLGITVVIDKANPRCALVQALSSAGLLPDWNKAHGSLRICAGDLITQVNDIEEDATAMCREIMEGRRGSSLRFRVSTSIAGQAVARHATCKPSQRGSRMSGTSPVTSEESEASARAVSDRAEAEAEAWAVEEAKVRAKADARHRAKADAAARAEAHARVRAKEEQARARAQAAADARAELEARVRMEKELLLCELQAHAIAWDSDGYDTEEAPPPLMSPDNHGCGEGEDTLSDASTDFPSSGAGTPPSATTTLPRRAAWV